MDLRQLEILRAIADTGSFHLAAAKLNLTQPAVSYQLKTLEGELGETLVTRSRPKVIPLPAGLVVLSVAERIFADIETLKLHFAPSKGADFSGVLRVTASTLGIVYLYGDLLEGFISKYPRIELIVTATETGVEGARQVLSGNADVAFAPFPVTLPSLETTPLGETEHAIIVSRSHPLARRRRATVEELKSHSFIRYQTEAGSRIVSDQVFLPTGGFPPIILESNDTEFIKRVVALGLGAAMVPAFTVTQEKRDRRLVTLQVKGIPRQTYGMVYRRGMRMRTLSLFEEFCLEHRASLGRRSRVLPSS
jgi:DNA-binding transcriptional LysR family regulator